MIIFFFCLYQNWKIFYLLSYVTQKKAKCLMFLLEKMSEIIIQLSK